MVEELQKILFGFVQAAFTGSREPTVDPDFDLAIELLDQNKTLRVQSFMAWPAEAKSGLKEILTTWLIVIGLDENDFPVPSSWLLGSSSTRLNEKIVAEILQRSDALILQCQQRRSAAASPTRRN